MKLTMKPMSLHNFADELNEIMPVLIREFSRRNSNELYKGKITLPQFLVMGFINGRVQAKMTDAARFMSVSTAAMTGIVNRMVRDGLVARLYDLKDRRVINIKLTPKGTALVKKIKEQRRAAIIKVFGMISEKERGDYLKIITRIHSILTNDKEFTGE